MQIPSVLRRECRHPSVLATPRLVSVASGDPCLWAGSSGRLRSGMRLGAGEGEGVGSGRGARPSQMRLGAGALGAGCAEGRGTRVTTPCGVQGTGRRNRGKALGCGWIFRLLLVWVLTPACVGQVKFATQAKRMQAGWIPVKSACALCPLVAAASPAGVAPQAGLGRPQPEAWHEASEHSSGTVPASGVVR